MDTRHIQIIQDCRDSLEALEKMSPLEPLRKRIEELDSKINTPGLWSNPKLAADLMKERKQKSDFIDAITQHKEHIQLYWDFGDAIDDNDTSFIENMNEQLKSLVFLEMMKDPIDKTPAIISISAGAGGLEAANWVTMLLRMYVRFADSQGFDIKILDNNPSEEHSSICTDSVSISIEGDYAYGFFKGESGVHRLIRNSPFNAAGARQTSFAAVMVNADIEDIIDVKINDKDVEFTAQAAGGPGGQNVTAVNSACR